MQSFLSDEQSTLDAGAAIGRLILTSALEVAPGFHVCLDGDLGAGKTTLVRGVLRGLGYAGRVKSPTYPLLETYALSSSSFLHFDLYRLESPESFLEAGFAELFTGSGIRFVEWPDLAGCYLPPPDWRICLQHHDCGRLLRIDPVTDAGQKALKTLSL
jgi:tRNA threonylcarbamoyladenosine biosynthesis protein TsaE